MISDPLQDNFVEVDPEAPEPPPLLELPLPAVTARLKAVNALLYKSKMTGDMDSLIGAVGELMAEEEFQEFLRNDPSLPASIKPEDLWGVAQRYLYFLLIHRRRVEAAMLCWGPRVFTPEPRSVRMIWSALDRASKINIIGGSAQGKTYSPSAWFLLEWVLDPMATAIDIVAPNASHLRKVLFADIQKLYNMSAIPLPGKADSEAISTDKKSGYGIFPVCITRGANSKGELKGRHPTPRSHMHPLFGWLTRRFVLIDEAQEVSENLFSILGNLTASVEEGDFDHVKIVMVANPKERESRFGQNCKPPKGWPDGEDGSEEWISETGWVTIRLNTMLSENILERRQVFYGFQTWDSVQAVLQKCGGDDQHPEMWTFVYGMFPPGGSMATIINLNWMSRCEGEFIFDTKTTAFGAFDPAYTGDMPAFATGRTGRSAAFRKYDGTVLAFEPRMVLQVDAVTILTRSADTTVLAEELMSICKNLDITPERLAIDKTGSSGVYDICRRQWNQKVKGMSASDPRAAEPVAIIGVSYSTKPTKSKICEEDSTLPYDVFRLLCDELWFAAAKFFEFQSVGVSKNVDAKTRQELTGRKGGFKAGNLKRKSIEPKAAYKARTGLPSPDRADAVTMLIHAVRMNVENFIAKSNDTIAEPIPKWPPEGLGEEEPVFQIREMDAE